MTNDPDSSQAPGDTECIPRSAPSAGNFADQSAILSELSSATPQRALSLLLVDQHRRWQSGARVSAESYLESAPVLNNDPEAAVALIYSEYLLREMLGERPSRDEFFSRFPQHAERLRVQFELHQALAHSASVEAVQHSLPSANLRVVRDSLPDVPGCVRMELLGRGGMGVVYRAWQPRLKRHVAVKMIRDAVLAGPEQRQRFQAEAQAVARLQHANIVQIFEIGEVAGRMFLVLEYVGGGNLATRLAAQPQPHTEAAELVEVLARAIHHAHERGVVHRDLKPANILMSASRDSDGRERQTPKITDFGLAKFTEEGASLAETGGIVGTPSYMAPEQAAGGATTVGAAADVYALGAILYEMLTGRPPFQAPTPLLTMELARTQEPVPPTRLQPKLPRDLETICLKCLRKEPDQRYSSAADLAEDLRRFRAGEPIRARPIGWARRSVKWARRRPAAAALIAVTVMSACVLLGVWIGFTQRLRGEVKQKEFERQRAFETYAASRRAMRQTLDKVREDPRIKDGPMNDLLFTIQKGEAEFYRAFVDLRADDMNYRAERAQALYELANLSFQWTSREETLGLFQEAIAELERLEQEQPSRIEHRVEWANAQMKLGTYFLTTHQLIEAERPFIRALDRLSELWDAHPERIDVRKRLAHGHRSLGMMRQMQQRPE